MPDDFNKTLESHLKEKFNEQRTQGILIGWYACCVAIQKKINKGMTYKQLKEFIKEQNEKREAKGL